MKIDYQDRIDSYLLGRMSDEEQKIFELDVAEDAELKEQLQFTETVLQVTRSRNEKLTAMEKWKDDYVWEDDRIETASASEYRPTGSGYDYCPAPSMESRKVTTYAFFTKALFWVSGTAAVLIVGVFVFNYFISPSSPEIAMRTVPYLTESSSKNSNVTLKGDNHDIEIENLLAMSDYSKALARIEKGEADIRTDLMLLERELQTRGQNDEDATTKKDTLENKLDSLLYLKAQALLGLDRKDEALALLDDIRHSDSDFGLKADSLYHLYDMPTLQTRDHNDEIMKINDAYDKKESLTQEIFHSLHAESGSPYFEMALNKALEVLESTFNTTFQRMPYEKTSCAQMKAINYYEKQAEEQLKLYRALCDERIAAIVMEMDKTVNQSQKKKLSSSSSTIKKN